MSNLPTISVRPGVYICPLLPEEFCKEVALGANQSEKQEELLIKTMPNAVIAALETHGVSGLFLSGMHPFTAEKGDKLLPNPFARPEVTTQGYNCMLNVQKAEKGGNVYLPELRWSSKEVPVGWGIVFKGSEIFGINRVHRGEACLLLLDFQYAV